MSNPQAKRKVMGRIDLAPDGNTSSPRAAGISPKDQFSLPRQNPTVHKGSHVRARVDMSSFSGLPSPQQQAPSATPMTESATPPPTAYSFNRISRPTSVVSGSSPFVSTSSLTSPSVVSRSNVSTSKSTVTASAPTSRALRSPSPIRQLTRNQPSASDVKSTLSNGDPVRVARERVSGGHRQETSASSNGSSSHVRVNSAFPSTLIGGGESSSSKGHVRAHSTISPFVNGNGHARVTTGGFNAPPTASPTIISRSRSPSPNALRMHRADRRTSQGSASSSTVGPSTRQLGTVPLSRPPRSPNTTTRPALHTNWSSYNSNLTGSEAGTSPSIASPSIAATIAKMPPFREPSIGEASNSNVSLPAPPLLSPSLELDAEAQEAKKNRKILDLEITNRSLLAINSGLEVVKLKQVREIRELKKRLREGRGLGSRMGVGTGDRTIDGDNDGLYDDDDDDEDGETEVESSDGEEGPLDVELESAHARCKALIDGMVEQARESILYKYQMDQGAKGGNRVLHPVEVEMLQSQEGEDIEDMGIASMSISNTQDIDELSKERPSPSE